MDRDELIRRIQSEPLSAAKFKPKDLHIDRRDGLRIIWEDGRSSHYSLVFLRKNCPCATCRENKAEMPAANKGLSLTILPPGIYPAVMFSAAHLVGTYALPVTRADGHTTGMYDFRYLRAVCESKDGAQSQAGT